jgi:hypothetical protein
MEILKRIIKFFKRKLENKQQYIMIDSPIEQINNDSKTDFINSLRANISEQYNRKKKVEVNECVGDGLGIQRKLSY